MEKAATSGKLSSAHSIKYIQKISVSSRVAQWKRAGPITQRSEDQNLALLDLANNLFCLFVCLLSVVFVVCQKTTPIRVVFSTLSLVFASVLKHGLSCLLYYINLSEVFLYLTVISYIRKKLLKMSERSHRI